MRQEYITGKAAWTNVKSEKMGKYCVSNNANHLHRLWKYITITALYQFKPSKKIKRTKPCPPSVSHQIAFFWQLHRSPVALHSHPPLTALPVSPWQQLQVSLLPGDGTHCRFHPLHIPLSYSFCTSLFLRPAGISFPTLDHLAQQS